MENQTIQNNLEILRQALGVELENILTYWVTHTPDDEHGGFAGQIDNENRVIPQANKGIILNTRLLWTFSNACNFYRNNHYNSVNEKVSTNSPPLEGCPKDGVVSRLNPPREDFSPPPCSAVPLQRGELFRDDSSLAQYYRPYADRAYEYLKKYFKDEKNGGVFWELDYLGNPVNRRKQIYAQAFAVYALSAYYQCSGNGEAKNWAVEIYEKIEKTARDREKLGYIEAFAEDWSPIADMRLSNKDLNASKTMNTHLHLLEAYTELLKIFPDKILHKNLHDLVRIFMDKFMNHSTFHCNLFFDDDWRLQSKTVSFGHDIETAWLLIEAAKILNDSDLLRETENLAINIADVFLQEALDKDFGVMNERHEDGSLDTDRHWWQQAEAIVGLCYALKISGNEKYLDSALKIWDFTKKFILDHHNGEWFWRVNDNGQPYLQEDKVGMWKCPYHNSRACVQILNLRI
ncbi:MAG: AGE family epimerase/isomerase [Tannerella sp.]|jgi:mannobiose 2-epimerase|nr:AGE family epimerase/isomerase [Tannerella sp.]